MGFEWNKLWSKAPSLDIPGLETVDLADTTMEKRIVRKQDLRILPWVCISYLLSESSKHKPQAKHQAKHHTTPPHNSNLAVSSSPIQTISTV